MSPKNDKNGPSYDQLETGTAHSRPLLHQQAREIQPYGKIAKLPIALDEKVCAQSAENLRARNKMSTAGGGRSSQ